MMRGLVQRVKRAEVRVDGKIVGSIGSGLCVFVGVTHDDEEIQAEKLAEKIANMRIMDGANGSMNLSISETFGEILVVSQFTLYGDVTKGRRPTWSAAATPEHAEPLINHVIEKLRSAGIAVSTGIFREYMIVDLVNDGPATLMVEV